MSQVETEGGGGLSLPGARERPAGVKTADVCATTLSDSIFPPKLRRAVDEYRDACGGLICESQVAETVAKRHGVSPIEVVMVEMLRREHDLCEGAEAMAKDLHHALIRMTDNRNAWMVTARRWHVKYARLASGKRAASVPATLCSPVSG